MITKTFDYITTWSSLLDAKSEIEQYLELNPKTKLAVDIETYKLIKTDELRPLRDARGNLNGGIRLIQIGLDPDIANKQFIIDIVQLLQVKTRQEISEILRPVLENNIILGHNLLFEYQHLLVHLDIELKEMRDTMLTSQVLYTGDKIVKHSLDKLYSENLPYHWFNEFTGKTFDEYSLFKKRLQKSNWFEEKLTDEQLRYAADDVSIIFHVYKALLLKVDEFIYKYERGNKRDQSIIQAILLENSLIPIYGNMELNGIKFDIRYQEEYVIPFLETRRLEAEKEVSKYFTRQVQKSNGKRGKAREVWTEEESINLGSWQQIQNALEPILGFKTTTDEDALRKHLDRHESIKWILQYKKANSLLTKFGQKFIDCCINSYIHPNWYQMGSFEGTIDTGRSSCAGPNLQQIPSREEIFGIKLGKLFRTAFIAEEGYVLLDADYSQIEPRITAELAGEQNMIKAFNSEGEVDLHALTAQALLGLPQAPPKDSYERNYIGKTANLALSYGAGPKKLAEFIAEETDYKINWTLDEAKEKLENYFTAYPGIRDRMNEYKHLVQEQPNLQESLAPYKGRKPFAVVFTEFGRARRFCLKVEQENFDDSVLHKYYKVSGENKNWNTFNQRLNEAGRESYNFCVQGLSADILKIALKLIYTRFREAGFDRKEGIIAVVHDEILAMVKLEHEDLAKNIIKSSMIEAGEMFLKNVPVIISIGSGSNWYEAK